jgi:hypothetical protein
MLNQFEEIMILMGGLGFINGYVKSAIEGATESPNTYTREVLLERLKAVSAKVTETLSKREDMLMELSQVSK